MILIKCHNSLSFIQYIFNDCALKTTLQEPKCDSIAILIPESLSTFQNIRSNPVQFTGYLPKKSLHPTHAMTASPLLYSPHTQTSSPTKTFCHAHLNSFISRTIAPTGNLSHACAFCPALPSRLYIVTRAGCAEN